MRSTAWLAVLAVVGSLVIGATAFNAGLAQGAAQAAAAAGNLPPYAYGWGWHGHWGGGFPAVLFLVFFWFVAFALVRRPWGRRYWHYYGGVPPSFEDWHRRAHERMGQDHTPPRA